MRIELDNFNNYHVDPSTTRGDATGRYPPNFVKFPWFLAPLNWGDSLSRAISGKPAYLLKGRLLKLFDKVRIGGEHWGTSQEIDVLRQNIQLFSDGVDANPYISPIGRTMIYEAAKLHLKNRAKTIEFYEANRAFIEANGRFKAPLIVTGFPRTGTTLLQRLLSEDPNTRSPYTYELEISVPPRKTAMDPLQDRRIRSSAASTARAKIFVPGMMEKFSESHLTSPTEQEESLIYMQFHNGLPSMNAGSAGRHCMQSMNQPEVADALFKYERNFFTMLDAYCPVKSHWTLKAPAYAAYFGKMLDYYPDARVVVTHRHPSKNFASICRLMETYLLPFDCDGSLDKIRLGSMTQEEMCIFLSRPLAFRQANPQRESQIVDCMYQDLFRDPIAMVKRIYQKFDIEYTPEFESRMQRYLADNQQGKHGRHKYSNEEYGIEPRRLYENNKAYFDHYGFKADASSAD